MIFVLLLQQFVILGTRPVILEDISPGPEKNLTPEVDHRKVPVGVADNVLEGPLAARQKCSEDAPHPSLGRLI